MAQPDSAAPVKRRGPTLTQQIFIGLALGVAIGAAMPEAGLAIKPLADYVHAQGLKFGVHLMRGIPRQAVADNVPILGTSPDMIWT